MSDKTYSGIQSYHEMLVRAQSLSPALTYVLCSLFLKIDIVSESRYQSSRCIVVSDEHDSCRDYFDSRQPDCSRMWKFLTSAFGGFNVSVHIDSCNLNRQNIIADTQFVRWLQSGVVTLDVEAELVTIKM